MADNWSDVFGNVPAKELAEIPYLAEYLRDLYEELCQNPNSGYRPGRYTWEDFKEFAAQINRDAASN